MQLYAAKNIAGGPDTVTVSFSANSSFIELYLTEYAGLDPVNPIDGQSGTSGNAGTVSSGAVPTTVAGDVIYGYCVGDWSCTVGSGFTAHSTLNNNLIEDKTAGNPGAYAATGTATNGWAMQMVALKPASSPDTTPPSAPANLSAAAANTQINLSWLASTDNVGVTGYLVERCQGSNCTTFVQIASLGGTVTSYSDTGLVSNTIYNYRVRAQDAAGNLSAYSNVATATTASGIVPPVISSSGAAAGTVGVAFSYQITATNSPTSFGASGLPTGLSVNNASGLISGTPTAAGSSNVTVSATNSGGTGSATLTITVTPAPPVITSSGTAAGTVGAAFSYQITATNSPTSFGASGLHTGLSVNATSGLISGTPTAAGSSNVTVSATNSAGTGTAPLTITVTVAPPVISSSGTAAGAVGATFSYQITATNSPTNFGASGLPAGLTVNTVTGQISGTPAAAATSTVALSATNSAGTGTAPLLLTISAAGTGPLVSHTIQISNDADDGYYNNHDPSGWHSTSQYNGADMVGSWGGIRTAWVIGYRFPSTGINSGDTIRSAYLQLVSSDNFATSNACGAEPCTSSIYTFRVYGVAQDDGAAFSNTAGNTPLDVPYTTAYNDYTTTGPGDAHGSCQGQNNGQNTCTHTIDVTNILKEITSRPGWTNSSAVRFVMVSMDNTGPNAYAGYEDYSANASKAATLVVNPPVPTIVSSGAWGTSPTTNYPTTYTLGPFVYPGASTLLLFLGDYYSFLGGPPISQPTVTDSCGNTWSILAGPTNWAAITYLMRSTVYYVQNPVTCPPGDAITVTADHPEPIYLHFLAVTGSDTLHAPVASAITSPSPGTYTTNAASNSIVLTKSGLLVSWIFGDSDAPHTFMPQTGFLLDSNSTPNYLTAVLANVGPGSYQSQFSISPSPDGWQVVIIGLQVP